MRLAAALLVGLVVAVPALADTFPWGPKDKPPAVAGVSLGDSEQHALDVLGPPDDSMATAAGDVLQYTEKGLEVTAARNVVTAIRILKPDVGAIGGLKVGDRARDVILKWGAPDGGDGRVARFGVGEWMILVRLAPKESAVAEIILASAKAQATPPPTPLNTFKTQ